MNAARYFTTFSAVGDAAALSLSEAQGCSRRPSAAMAEGESTANSIVPGTAPYEATAPYHGREGPRRRIDDA
jgi:hypothetical protein